jgi:hypothetical protein
MIFTAKREFPIAVGLTYLSPPDSRVGGGAWGRGWREGDFSSEVRPTTHLDSAVPDCSTACPADEVGQASRSELEA